MEDNVLFNIENSGLLVVGRRNAQNDFQIVAKLGLSVGLNHSNGLAEITERWLPWSSLLEKLKVKHQAYAVDSTEDGVFLCFNETSLRTFTTGLSYERHTMQIIDRIQRDVFETDLLTVHWNPYRQRNSR